tara:strand:+ start:1048 stop:1812 length:765 start_codon:yes stop_codon:yes gene_type:complete
MLSTEIIPCLQDNYSYIIYDSVSDTVGVVDPSEFEPIDQIISKKYKKINYILNTHHHFDHVGGNLELKEKYNAKIVCSELDKNRIPGSEIILKSDDEFKFGSIIFKIIFVPGHTSGHIIFYSKEENTAFTGDTLFSLGCGKIFEGTYDQMFASLNKIRNLNKRTKIYCGHEYTKSNFDFCYRYDNENKDLIKKLKFIEERINKKLPTIPVTLEEELKTNIFLRCNNTYVKGKLKMPRASEELIFKKLRDLKDKF